MTRQIGIAGMQMSPVPWDTDATLNTMGDAILQVARSFPWVQMIVFHELIVPGLVQFTSASPPGGWGSIGQTIPGPATERLCEYAHRSGCWIVPGSLYEKDGDTLYNTAIAISPTGDIVARYRKMFPWFPYESNVTAGTEFCVFDVPDVGRFGLCICYDMWFPEVARSLVWMGAEVILHPTMTPTSDRAQELILSQANAIFNQCYFVDVNGIGPYGGGRSMIVDPDGRVLQEASTHPTILTEIIDLDRVNHTREAGTIGLGQTLKQLRDCGHRFPIYGNGVAQSESLATLGKLELWNTRKQGSETPARG